MHYIVPLSAAFLLWLQGRKMFKGGMPAAY
jgi:hypothetical protein